ncbi:uncharacterized protein TNCT_33971 [Trichonephila clavata]|uniref:Uncharacterized protein n=1 Tax=Trichonephila clavata TaxID=2740835 RepID=A0A8X6F4R9_TRICU|nr:uncharacterized protein TNCT_33971 [Trichonephila clavata]
MPKYETDDTTNDEVYVIQMDGSMNWGVDKEGNQRYAKKENGDEYYPANGEFACDHSGSPQYARTRDGKVIFPLDAERNESYLKDDGETHVIYMGDVLLDRYAKTKNGEEIYPIQVINPTLFKEIILNEKYAKTALQEAKYPLDEYGNEYTFEIPADIAEKAKDYFPLGYPITNDCWVIIPEVNGKKSFLTNCFPKCKLPTLQNLLENLGNYCKVYEYFRSFSFPPYRINETFSRKPVTCVATFQGLKGVFAHKLDGTFGLVYSFPEYIKEKWEGGIHKIHKGISLGDGIVFSAEKLSNGTVVLLDVYQVRGFPTVQWNREIVLINFLQHLSLPEGYETQTYCHRVEDLPMTRYETDGYIIHNTKTDKIVKVKHTHSLDVVYMDVFFWLPGKEKPGSYRRFKALEKGLQNGHVYEVPVKNGNVLRERKDRFIGNTWKQIENILEKQSWQGPTIHEVVKVIKTTKRKCKSKAT